MYVFYSRLLGILLDVEFDLSRSDRCLFIFFIHVHQNLEMTKANPANAKVYNDRLWWNVEFKIQQNM